MVHPSGFVESPTCLSSGEIVAAGACTRDFFAPSGGSFIIDRLAVAFNSAGTQQWLQSANFAGTQVEEFGHVVDAGQGRVVLQGFARNAQGVGLMCETGLVAGGSPTWTVSPQPIATGGNSIVGGGVFQPGVLIVVTNVSDVPFGEHDLLIARLNELKPAFCHGDGSSVACPCGNVGATGHGCPSSVSPAGARLSGLGQERVSLDTLVLSTESAPNGPRL